ncbi:MAG: M48 family metalloprotease [Calditrichia bacterium]
MQIFKRIHVFMMMAFIAGLILSCATNPVTGKKQLMLLSNQEEIKLGEQSDGEIVNMYGKYNDPELSRYIADLGMRMARISHRPDLPYEFRLLDSPVINAFAVPGGFVYITRGILAYLNNEAELAGVMGHEIGHITARHSAQQYTKAQIAQLGLGVGMVLSENFRKYAGVAQFGVGMLFLKFSRDNERQSDELGVQYSTTVGYDAMQMANFFETLERMQPKEGGTLPDWFSTHPNPADRVVAVRKLATEWEQKLGKKDYIVARDEYLRKIDGLIYGDDPRQGFTENNVFYHPDLKFRFNVPSEWKVTNTPSQVQIVNPQQDAVVMLTMETGLSPAEAAGKFTEKSAAVVLLSEPVNVNGFQAQKTLADINSDQGSIRVMSYFIEKDRTIYVLHGFALQTAFQNYQSAFENSMKSFAKLTDQKILNVQPDRIWVKKTTRPGNFRDAVVSAGGDPQKIEELSLINGIKPDATVLTGTTLKIVVKGK